MQDFNDGTLKSYNDDAIWAVNGNTMEFNLTHESTDTGDTNQKAICNVSWNVSLLCVTLEISDQYGSIPVSLKKLAQSFSELKLCH